MQGGRAKTGSGSPPPQGGRGAGRACPWVGGEGLRRGNDKGGSCGGGALGSSSLSFPCAVAPSSLPDAIIAHPRSKGAERRARAGGAVIWPKAKEKKHERSMANHTTPPFQLATAGGTGYAV